MFKLLGKIPRKVNLAFSGGVDSLSVAHFLMKNHDVTLLHFNHGCQYSDQIEADCHHRVENDLNGGNDGVKMVVGRIEGECPKGQSLEDFWRRQRYKWLRSFDEPFITCHHLDDAVETWVWSSLHGNPKLIPASDDKVLRPFLLTEKTDFILYSHKNRLISVPDPYNYETHLTRNYIRANIMPHAYYVNPGLKKVIKKKYLSGDY